MQVRGQAHKPMPLKTSVSKCMWPKVINLNFDYVALLYAARMLVEMVKLKQRLL